MSHYKELRLFVLSNDKLYRSNIWRIVIENDGEIYVMSEQNGKDIKISIHKSGEIHSGLTGEVVKRLDIHNQERYFCKRNFYPESEETAIEAETLQDLDLSDKHEIAYCVIFPCSELSVPYIKEQDLDKNFATYAVILPNDNSVCEIYICISHMPGFVFESEGDKRFLKIASVVLPNGKELVIFSEVYILYDELRSFIVDMKKWAKRDNPPEEYKWATVPVARDSSIDALMEIYLDE